jgi:hypothetical protein
MSLDDGDHWQSLQLNLPHTSMRDLWIHENDLIVATHGRGFWILDDIAPLRELTASVSDEDHLFTPAPAFRIQRDTYSDTPLPPDEPAAANPPDGAIVDYYLAQNQTSPVTLEILDAHGQLVRKYSSDDKAPVSEDDLSKQLIPLYWLKPFRMLPADAGMHRWVWDLHYSTPDSTRHDYPISAVPGDTPRFPLGPNALPGSYTARLTVNGKSSTTPFTVRLDPRIKISAADLEKKFQTERKLASMLDQTSKAVAQAASIREQLRKITQQSSGASLDAVKNFENKLAEVSGAPGGSPAPPSQAPALSRVNGDAETLYGQVWQVDAAPTTAQTQATASSEHDVSQAMQRWESLKSTDLATLNRALHDANLPEVKIESDPHYAETGMDEE